MLIVLRNRDNNALLQEPKTQKSYTGPYKIIRLVTQGQSG